MKSIICIGIFILSFPYAQAQYSERAKAELRNNCKKNDAKSCAYLGAIEMKTNPNQAKVYYQQACALGYTPSCVFVGVVPQNTKTVEPHMQRSPSADDEVSLWIETKMGHLLSALVDTTPGSHVSHFSVDQCRMPLSAYIMLVMKLKKSYSHAYKFGPGCDLDGVINIQFEVPFLFDLQGRKLEEVVRMTGEVDVRIEKLSAVQYKQISKIYNVVAYDSESKVVGRFAMTHEQIIDIDMANKNATVVNNYGTARVLELRGKALAIDKPFVLDNIIKRIVLRPTPY
jgi:hypothetical protein